LRISSKLFIKEESVIEEHVRLVIISYLGLDKDYSIGDPI
jgi:hypothetical protein